MNNRPAEHTVLTLTLAAALAGCGIDQGGAPEPAATGPQAVVVQGPITGFGSVIVNGLTLDASGAQILVDGEPATEMDLAVGQVIRAVASVTQFSTDAVLIEHQENVRGPIMALDAVAGSLMVLGQPIEVDAGTVFAVGAGAALADLMVGQVVEVSGLKSPSGALIATYIGDAPAGAPFEVTTRIDAVDLVNQTFALAGLSVDYSQAMLLDLLNGLPEIGLVVEVEGSALDAAGLLVADIVRLLPSEPGLFSAVDTDASGPGVAIVGAPESTPLGANFIGFITAANLPDQIMLGDVEVTLTGLTIVEGGVLDDLQPGIRVQVRGTVVTQGIIEAERITIL